MVRINIIWFKTCDIFPLSGVKIMTKLANFNRNTLSALTAIASRLQMKESAQKVLQSPRNGKCRKRKTTTVAGRSLGHTESK